ncbi:short chain dehydrogenase/oxidoreductase CpoX2 [Aspergillus egyptiacus]|nr:short chain dehydrogenase/oxidoreductase CpoX2 [Aspergillus egyptiacus]
MASVSSKIFAVTGGASGIGAATSRLLAQRGAAVICIGDISSQNFDNLKKEIATLNASTKVHCTKVDVSSSTEVETWIQSIITTFGDLHGLANVAGIAQPAGVRKTPVLAEETDEEWSRVFKVNLDGIFYCTRAAIRAMKGLPRQDRAIANVGSIAAFIHLPDAYAYGTSKGACAYFTTCAATDAFPLGIRINSVSPGITDTPLLPQFMPQAKTVDEVKEAYIKEGYPIIQPDDVARTIVWLLSDDSRPVYGANINVGAATP